MFMKKYVKQSSPYYRFLHIAVLLYNQKEAYGSFILLSIVFRQGDIGTNFYAVLSGSLDVSVSETERLEVRWTLL